MAEDKYININTDLDVWSEALNDKMDRNAYNANPTQTGGGLRLNNVITVVETGKSEDGTKWYRLWSDGWCEQGGRFYNNAHVSNTITFLKPFKDTSFTVLTAHGVTGYYEAAINGQHTDEPYDFTTTSFKIWTHNSVGINTVQWEAKGYIAQN